MNRYNVSQLLHSVANLLETGSNSQNQKQSQTRQSTGWMPTAHAKSGNTSGKRRRSQGGQRSNYFVKIPSSSPEMTQEILAAVEERGFTGATVEKSPIK